MCTGWRDHFARDHCGGAISLYVVRPQLSSTGYCCHPYVAQAVTACGRMRQAFRRDLVRREYYGHFFRQVSTSPESQICGFFVSICPWSSHDYCCWQRENEQRFRCRDERPRRVHCKQLVGEQLR